ncbi:hypothetical protein QE361_003495 [Sphingomonas sp. SORGH_AS802]|nr:hypothetical protein [Sphingomonas sp. SORGH_AS_0438]MDR6136488.1 hypothetical protein [Sphingomonas sp. SORGH_AS_0802]
MPVQRLPWDTRFGDLRLRPAQCRLGEAQPGRCHLERPPVVPAAGTRRFQTGAGALDDQFALELGEASKKTREDQPAVGGGGVDRRALNRRDQTSSVEPALCPHVGETTTDAEQRLTVLGNKGISAGVDGSVAITFANNEGWYDDISDGPVTANVILNGQALEFAPA